MPKSGESKKSEVVEKKQKTLEKNQKIDVEKNKKSEKKAKPKEIKNEKSAKAEPPKEVQKENGNINKESKEKKKVEKIANEKKKMLESDSKEKSVKSIEKKTKKAPFLEDSLEEEKQERELESQKKDWNFLINAKNSIEKKQKKIALKKEFQTLEVVVLVFLTCFISLIVGGLIGIKFKEKNTVIGDIEIAGEEIQDFLKDYNYLIENYYGDIDKKELLNTAFKSMVDSLGDSYSGALDESTSNNFDIELKGDYEGLGIEIINDSEKNILIYGIIPNSPASKADIKIGDKLLMVNGTDLSGMSTTDFIKNVVKGSGATEFVIALERDGIKKEITLKKEAITLESVSSTTYYENGKRIAYIKVSIFAENTYSQFKNTLSKLESEGFESLIIDLRDNSGGHLSTVKNMISLFLDSSHVIYQTEDKKGKEKVYSSGKITKNYPIVIVGNSMSASASEVMIGALTEEYGAILIGNQSFGKGTVQELHSLTNGDEYKFTTKKWLTPKGNWVHNNGIKPNVEVTLSKDYYENPIQENDNQLRTAINYLAGVQYK